MFGQKTAFDYTIGGLAFLLILLQGYLLIQYWSDLPERLPMHYNFRGEPDSYGSKTSILFLPLLGVALFVMMTFVAMNPQSMNLPVKVTDENREQVYAQGVRFVHVLRLLISVLFAYLLWGTISVGMGWESKLDNRVLFGFLGWESKLDNRVLFGFLGLLAATMIWFFNGFTKK